MDSEKKHFVIIMPGLGDHGDRFKWLTQNWEKDFQLTPVIHYVPWEKREESFDQKLRRLEEVILELRGEENNNISLIGSSAAGSLAFNGLIAFPGLVSCAVDLCGRLTRGSESGYRSFSRKSKRHTAFAESVTRFEQSIPDLDSAIKARMLITKGFYDELVPEDAMTVDGIRTIRIPLVEHGVCICASIATLPWLGRFTKGKEIAEFIKKAAKS